MAAPLILARTFRDAHAYAQGKLGLSIGHYRVVNSPGTLKAVRGTEIHLVEGWDKRPDRFSMKSAMRYCHNRIVDTTLVPAEAPAFECSLCDYTSDEFGDTHTHPEPAPEDKRYPLDERTHTIALRYNSLQDSTRERVLAGGEEIGTIAGTPVIVHPTAEEAEAATLEAAAQVTQDDEPAEAPAEPAVKPKARRRSRCKDCGTLHYKDEPCPSDAE